MLHVGQLNNKEGKKHEKLHFADLVTCQCGASAVLSSDAKSLVSDETFENDRYGS